MKTLFQKWFIALSVAVIVVGCGAAPQGTNTPVSDIDNVVWTKQFGTASYDWTNDVSVDANGNIYVAGGTAGGLDGNISAGEGDGFLVKYDPSGMKQWTKQLATTSEDRADGVSIDADGNVYTAGTTYGGLDGNINTGGSDGFLIKYNSSGIKQWTKQFGTASGEWASDVSVDVNGNIYVAGDTSGGLDGNVNVGSSDGFLVKYDSSGVEQWAKQFGTASGDAAYGVATYGNGNVYVTGSTQGGLDGNTSAGSQDGFLVKYDSSGVKQWTRQFGTASYDWTNDVSVDANGNIYVAGGTEGGLDGNTNAGFYDGFIVKYDPTGAKQWTKQFGTADDDEANGVSVDATGNLYVAGHTYSGLDGNVNRGSGDGFLVKYDLLGVKQWTRQFGTASYDEAGGASIDASGNIYVAGVTYGGLDGNVNAGDSDGFLVKYDANGNKQ